jgi:hypothetical protein
VEVDPLQAVVVVQAQMVAAVRNSMKELGKLRCQQRDVTDPHCTVRCILGLSLMEFHLLLLNKNRNFRMLLTNNK